MGEARVFVAWRPGLPDPVTGKFPKWPVGANGWRLTDWQKPENQIPLAEAIERAAGLKKFQAGIGVAFTGDPIAEVADGGDIFLVALDLDNVVTLTRDEGGDVVEVELTPYARKIVEQVGSYAEISPSGRGIRILAFTKEPVRSAKAAKTVIDGVEIGREIFASSGFVTLTGWRINSYPIRIRTKVLAGIAVEWGAGAARRSVGVDLSINNTLMPTLNRATAISEGMAAAPFVDTEDYDDFKDVMMAVAALRPLVGDDVADGLATDPGQ